MRSTIIFCFTCFMFTQTSVKAQPCTLVIVPTSSTVCPGYQATITAFGANSYTWTGTSFMTPVLNQSLAAGPGTYTVSGNNNSCLATITILQQPLSIQISQSSATTCIQSGSPLLSKPLTLTASGAGSYTWYPLPSFPNPSPQITVRPAANTCYTVVGESSTCSGTAVACVTVVPQFSIAAGPHSASICAGAAVSLSVSQTGAGAIGPESAFTYIWAGADTTFSTNNKTVSATPSVSTLYTITVLDADQCLSAPATASITVNVCIDVLEQKIFQAKIFPNPFNEYLDIDVSGAILIEITNTLGKKVMTIKPDEKQSHSVDTRSLQPGVYSVILTYNTLQKSVFKLIKN